MHKELREDEISERPVYLRELRRGKLRSTYEWISRARLRGAWRAQVGQ